MRTAPESIEAALLRLPASDRARLAQLLASLDEDADPDVDRAWADEAEHRLAELRAETVPALPAAQVHERIRTRLREGNKRAG